MSRKSMGLLQREREREREREKYEPLRIAKEKKMEHMKVPKY
jgi:hypothetical protein